MDHRRLLPRLRAAGVIDLSDVELDDADGARVRLGDWQELPAVLILNSRCRVVWVHRGRYLGDHSPITRVMRRLEEAIDRGSGS